MDPAIIRHIAQEVALPESSVAATLALLEAGAAAPFIVRFRKEATGGLKEANVRAIQDRMIYYQELEERRAALAKTLVEQGRLTAELRRRIERCWEKADIEDLHHLFRPKRRTRAGEAIEKGLEPLAEYIWSQDPDAWTLEEHIDVFIDPLKGVADRQQALQGASEIIADWIAENFELRKALREMLWKEGVVISTVVPAKAGLKTKYNMYYDRREPVASIPSHRVLAIRRGTKEGVLTSSIQCDSAKALQMITDAVIRDRESVFAPLLEAAARDSYSRILRPLIETEVRAQLKERADREAIRVFQENLENLLMSPPCGGIPVIGVDAGKGEECRLAAVDEQGRFLEEAVVYPRPPRSDIEGTKSALLDLIQKHHVRALAFGSGPGAREAEAILRQILADAAIEGVLIATVNDAGIVVYSSSRIGREELPDLAPSTRSAVSIARRLQDPLAELVKIDPKLIGVGQYQHDVDQKELHRRLVQTVQFCVNRVGADLNAASFSLLRYISGVSDRLARRIVTHRGANGAFSARSNLLSIPGVDKTLYRLAAGFVRLPESDVLLDRSWIHPDCHPVVEKMAASLNVASADLIANPELSSALKLEDFVTDTIGIPTLVRIREELLAPGRDPRGTYTPPKVRGKVKDIADLIVGTTLEGSVTNVTNFGAFIDIGIHQDGLVHLSQMSNRFIRDPREAVKVGDLVQVKVISVEVETKRIGLSMKALMPAVPKRRRTPRRRPSQPEQAASSAGAAPSEPAAAAGDPAAPPDPAGEAPRPQPARRTDAAHQRPHRRRSFSRRNDDPAMSAAPGRGASPGTTSRPRNGSAAPHRPAPPPVEPEPKEPERTLQEKIAILQSKFRGIS
jgi:uncharacterized protein